MDDGRKALVGFVGAHGDAFELFEFAEEVFDQMTPLVHLLVEEEGKGASGMRGDDDLGAALAISLMPIAPKPFIYFRF